MKPLVRILHVEDEPDIQAVAKLTLENIGSFTVLACSSGAEALDKILSFAPDLVLLDVMMPGLDGPATMAEMRKIPKFKTTPMVFLTAKAQTHEIEEFLKLGATDVMTKPFDPVTLCVQIKQIWSRLPDTPGYTTIS
jgi:CheY-like chemotaxis protein